MSNFDFLKDYDYDLWNWGNKLEHDLVISPAAVVTYATRFLERVLELLIRETGTKVDMKKEFYYKLDTVFRENDLQNGFKQSIYAAYMLRSKIHITSSSEMEKNEIPIAKQLHEMLYHIGKKLYRDFYPDYNHYKGVPAFRPVEVDTSSEELDLIDIPAFQEILDSSYDYCIICGKPNHSNYSLCCHKCNRVMDNANNFISIRNYFGKNAEFKKEDLIEYGIPEGYVNQFLNSLTGENMLKASGINYTFNNMGLDDYLSKIDNYINICELITKFREDKIDPKDIRQTREYREGGRKIEPFKQFHIIVNREIRKKFERQLLSTRDVWASIDYAAFTDEELERWYKKQHGKYQRGEVNDAFVVFNDLMIEEYLELKSEGILESEIKKTLNISGEVYEFWHSYKSDFERRLKGIKLDLIEKAIQDGMSRDEIIEYAGVTPKEYENIFKVADHKGERIAQIRNQELESRKGEFVKYLYNFDLEIACKKAKIPLKDFYEYYENSSVKSTFYVKTTRYLMDKYLLFRRRGRTRSESIGIVGIKQEYLNRWLKRSAYAKFQDEDLKVTVDLIIKGFKQKKPLAEIAVMAETNADAIKRNIRVGEKGSEIFRPLFEYYEGNVIPEKLSKFLTSNKNKTIREALKISDLAEEEMDKYYQLGKDGDERFADFYRDFYEIKKRTYVLHINKGKSHKIAMRESHLTEEEYIESKDDFDEMLRLIKFTIILDSIRNNKTSNVAASRAGCSVDDIYEWYFMGKNGEEDYVEFYEAFHKGYVRPSIKPIQDMLDSEQSSYESIIRSNKDKFTRRDVEIWIEHGLITQKVVHISSKDDEEEEDDEDDKKKVRKINIRTTGKAHRKRSSLGLLMDNDMDVEKLKKEIMKKS